MRISGRFFGPLIPGGELVRVRRFFRDARGDGFLRISRYFNDDDKDEDDAEARY